MPRLGALRSSGEQGRGATFSVGSGKRILWIDDAIRKYYHAVSHLVFAGFEVSTARGYFEAKQKLEQHRFDYLLLDFDLGEGATGFDIIRDLVLAGGRTRMMFVTAYFEEATRRRPAALAHIPIFDKMRILSGATSRQDNSALIEALEALSPATIENSRAALKRELQEATKGLRPSGPGRLIPRWRSLAKGKHEAVALAAALPMLALVPSILAPLRPWLPAVVEEHVLLHFLAGLVLVPALVTFFISCPHELRQFDSVEALYRAISEQADGAVLLDGAKADLVGKRIPPSSSAYLLAQQYWLLLDASKWPQRLVIALLALSAFGIFIVMYAELFIVTTINAAEALYQWVQVKYHLLAGA